MYMCHCAPYMYMHHSTIGLSKEAAVHRYIVKVCELDLCGANFCTGQVDGQPVSLSIGPRNVHLLDSDQRTLNRYMQE